MSYFISRFVGAVINCLNRAVIWSKAAQRWLAVLFLVLNNAFSTTRRNTWRLFGVFVVTKADAVLINTNVMTDWNPQTHETRYVGEEEPSL